MRNFRDMFRRDGGDKPPETKLEKDKITLPQDSPEFNILKSKMGVYQQRSKVLLSGLEKSSQVSGDVTEQVNKALFEAYKYSIRLHLVSFGSVEKQSVADYLTKHHPTKFYQFQEDIFNKAFEVVRGDIELKKLRKQ